jgi:hypothetical protein
MACAQMEAGILFGTWWCDLVQYSGVYRIKGPEASEHVLFGVTVTGSGTWYGADGRTDG